MLVSRIRCNVPQQVGLAQNGKLAISGSDRGEVYIWERKTGDLRQVLRHGGNELTFLSPGFSHSYVETGIYCNQALAVGGRAQLYNTFESDN